MINLDIAHRRLHNQHITRRTLETPQALVEWLGAVQSQDYAAAKWGSVCACSAPIRPANDAARLLLRSQAGRAEKA